MMHHDPPTSSRRRAHRWLWVPAVAVLLALTACPDDSDDSAGDAGTTHGDPENEQEQEQDANDEDEDESLEASNHDQTLQLTVDSVAREGDLVVVEGTLTNTGNERFIPRGQFAELDDGGLERFTSNDLSGVVVIDWEHSTAHYPARTDAGQCACTIVEDYTEGTLDPGASTDYFVAYELDDPSSELTLVAPGSGRSMAYRWRRRPTGGHPMCSFAIKILATNNGRGVRMERGKTKCAAAATAVLTSTAALVAYPQPASAHHTVTVGGASGHATVFTLNTPHDAVRVCNLSGRSGPDSRAEVVNGIGKLTTSWVANACAAWLHPNIQAVRYCERTSPISCTPWKAV